jgi:hypothetical protein
MSSNPPSVISASPSSVSSHGFSIAIVASSTMPVSRSAISTSLCVFSRIATMVELPVQPHSTCSLVSPGLPHTRQGLTSASSGCLCQFSLQPCPMVCSDFEMIFTCWILSKSDVGTYVSHSRAGLSHSRVSSCASLAAVDLCSAIRRFLSLSQQAASCSEWSCWKAFILLDSLLAVKYVSSRSLLAISLICFLMSPRSGFPLHDSFQR